MNNWTTDITTDTGIMSRLDEFRCDSLRRVSLMYVTWLAVALVLVIISFLILRGAGLRSIQPLVFVYYVILAAHITYRLRTGGSAAILAPDVIFAGFYTIFHLGYVTLFALGLAEFHEKIFWAQASAPKAMFIVNLGLVGFFLGHELVGGRSHQYGPVRTPTWTWPLLSIILIAAGLILHIACLFMIGISTIMHYGYIVLANVGRYSTTSVEIAFWASSMMGILGTLIYTVSSALRHGKLFKSPIALALSLTFAVIFLLEGDRGYFVQMVMPMIMIRHYFVKKINLWIFAAMMAGILVLLAGISVVRTVVFDPSKMIEEYGRSRAAGGVDWRSPFLEAGGTFRIPSMITHEVPGNAPYWKGQSYISALIRIVPFLDGITQRAGLRGPPSYGISPAAWLTFTYVGREASGLGFSVCAEGYLNFGYPGAFLELVVLGMFVRWLMVQFSRRPSPARAIIMLGCLGTAFMVARGHSQNMTSFCMQVFVMAGLLSLVCKNEPVAAGQEVEIEGVEPAL